MITTTHSDWPQGTLVRANVPAAVPHEPQICALLKVRTVELPELHPDKIVVWCDRTTGEDDGDPYGWPFAPAELRRALQLPEPSGTIAVYRGVVIERFRRPRDGRPYLRVSSQLGCDYPATVAEAHELASDAERFLGACLALPGGRR